MRNLSDSYPAFYKNSPEFQALIYVLACEILKLWYSYTLFYEYVVLRGQNPTVIPKDKSTETEVS